MINSVFGFGTVETYDGESRELCLYVSDAKVWKEERCCSDYTNQAELEVLGNLGFGEEMDAVFKLLKQKYNGLTMVDVEQLTREEIQDKLTDAGFVYDAKFEEFMKDCTDEE